MISPLYLILAIVFAGVFVLVVLLMAAMGTGASEQVKQRLAGLDSALAASGSGVTDDMVDIRKQELLSSLPLLNRLLIQADLAPRLRTLLYQADLQWTVGGLLLMSIAAAVFTGYLVSLRTDALILSIVLGAIAGALPFAYVFYKRNKRFAAFEQKLPDALDLIVGALRAGHSLTSGLGIVAREASEPVGREIRICFDEQNFGVDLRTAMVNLAARVPIQDVRIVVTAILIQRESGGNLAEVLEKVAEIIRDRFRLKRQIRVHTAQGRLTGWILAVLPLVLGIALYLVNPEHLSILWKRPIGLKLIYASAVMTSIGALIIRSIIRIRV